MFSMVMTLEVSKLSGWLNADASCRESKGGHAVCMGRGMRVGRRGGGGRRRLKERAGQGLTADYRGKALEERTPNMYDMVVTREVSKLSGWLNTDAYCRESKGGHTRCGVSRGPEGGRGLQTTAAQEACRERLDCRLGAGHGE